MGSNGGDGASLVLQGGDTSSENPGLLKLLGGKKGKDNNIDESNLGLIEINDINIGIKGGKSETDVGGNIDIHSGTSASSSSGKVMLSSGISTTSGIVTLQSGNSDDRSGDTNIVTGISSNNQAGNINIKPGMSNGGDGASLVLQGEDTSSENPGLLKLLGGKKGEDKNIDESNLGLIEIKDINIGIKGGKSETDAGGNIDIHSGTSASSSSGKVMLSSGISTTSCLLTLQSGNSDHRS